jgi:hypothetical protein
MFKLIVAVCIDVTLVLLEYDTRSRCHAASRHSTRTPTIIRIGSSEPCELNQRYRALRADNPHYLIRGY